MSAFIVTRIHVGDYDTWRTMYDQHRTRAREQATAQRVLRSVDEPERGVHGPNVLEDAG